MKDPLITVILPNYNHAAFLEERLQSILNQTYSNFELIILDDASIDESLLKIEKYREHKKVSHIIINKKNTGSPFVQWKKGLELARGKYIWIAESDDTCETNFLETQLQHLKNSNLSIAKTISFDSNGVKGEIQHPVYKEENDLINNEQILYCPILNVSSILFNAPDIKELANAQFSNFKLIGDRVFYFEFFQHKRVARNPDTTSFFRKEDAGLSNLKSKGLDYLKEYFEEHVKFIRLAARKEQGALDHLVNTYIIRFYTRVRNRVSRKNKISLQFLSIYIYYKYELIKTKVISL